MTGPYVLGLLSARGEFVFLQDGGCYSGRCPCCEGKMDVYWNLSHRVLRCYGQDCTVERVVAKLGGEPVPDPWEALEEARKALAEAKTLLRQAASDAAVREAWAKQTVPDLRAVS